MQPADGAGPFSAGAQSTRMVIACSQVLFSSLLIHLTGGRIETHFHVFGSLAFLAAYRDWRVLMPATLIVAVDHFIRGVWWPETVFGIASASEWRWMEHAAWVVFEDVFLIICIRQNVVEMHDSARKKTELEFTAAELAQKAEQIRKLSLVASHARHGIVITDQAGKAEWINDSFTQMSGYEAAEMYGRVPWSFMQGPQTNQETVRQIQEQIANCADVDVELVQYTKSGEPFWSSFRIRPILDEGGALTNFISTQINISDRKARELELHRAKDEAESANRAKSQFLANMSHEIRTPLNGILGFSELLRRSTDKVSHEDRDDYLESISTSGRHLLTLINDILDISKIEADRLQVECIPCSPHQIIAEIVSVLRVSAEDKGISLDYRWESEVPETIQSDPQRLKQLLINVVGNAIKFTEQGSVLIVALLEWSHSGRVLRLEIRDTGIGISQDKLQTIFEPFAQADDSITRKHGGTGLGLAISRRLARALGGEVSVTSELGRGSVFCATVSTGDLTGVTIHEKPPEVVVGDVTHQNSINSRLDGLRILLVEDGDTNRKLLRLTLSRSGATVTTAENGRIALHLVGEGRFDIILMDMQMPVMDGYTATSILRDRGFDGPIIALTAHAMKGDRERCEEAGCSGYLTKPVNMDDLLQTVLTASGRAKGEINAENAEYLEEVQALRKIPAIVRSTLPTEDAQIREIVTEFVVKLPAEISKMEHARSHADYEQLAILAHWLRGAGGTVGFDCFIEPARHLEILAAEKADKKIGALLERLRSLNKSLVV